MNLPPAGTISGVDTGAGERRLKRSKKARSPPKLFGRAEVAAPKSGLSVSSMVSALASMIGGVRPVRATSLAAPKCMFSPRSMR